MRRACPKSMFACHSWLNEHVAFIAGKPKCLRSDGNSKESVLATSTNDRLWNIQFIDAGLEIGKLAMRKLVDWQWLICSVVQLATIRSKHEILALRCVHVSIINCHHATAYMQQFYAVFVLCLYFTHHINKERTILMCILNRIFPDYWIAEKYYILSLLLFLLNTMIVNSTT